ncbi:MAG: helix-turn-helix domain-containing protein [Methylovulum sp.]|nr:helix-turn-helix domain-containing protein [Methylovulum sp.]
MTKEKRPVGRPTDYRPECAQQAYECCLLGADDDGLADYFEVSQKTINTWKRKHPEFLQSILDGKLKADAKVAAALYKSAIGEHVITEERIVNTPDGHAIVQVKRQAEPNVNAQRMWLHNRQPDKWRDKQVHQVDVTVIPQAKLDEIHQRNIEKQREMMKPVLGRAQRLGIASFVEVMETNENKDN